jgi:uncharacterized membrane protein
MIVNKAQDEINKSEWENGDNWTTIYFSKKDSRSWVPKKNPKHGWTINFGSPSGARWIYYLFILFLLLGILFGAVFTSIVKCVN